MKNVFFFLLIVISTSIVNCQSFLKSQSIDWTKYEETYDDEFRISEIAKIKDDLLFYLNESDMLEDNIDNFHFIDFNGNCNIDIIYSGDAGTDKKRTLIFELSNDGSYRKTFDKFGRLIDIFSGTENLPPYSLILMEEPCCGGFSTVYEIYHPIISNGKVELHVSIKYSSILGTDIPAEFFSKPKMFEVINNLYYLRLDPILDNNTVYEDLHITGNIIAEYYKGSKGYAVAEREDNTNRIWWFVIMQNTNKTSKGIFDVGSNNENEAYYMGWMSSRYLIEINK
ncbi:MAG: hypothetical protein WD607_02570 [Candidatus Paceibacterota bacterium]